MGIVGPVAGRTASRGGDTLAGDTKDDDTTCRCCVTTGVGGATLDATPTRACSGTSFIAGAVTGSLATDLPTTNLLTTAACVAAPSGDPARGEMAGTVTDGTVTDGTVTDGGVTDGGETASPAPMVSGEIAGRGGIGGRALT